MVQHFTEELGGLGSKIYSRGMGGEQRMSEIKAFDILISCHANNNIALSDPSSTHIGYEWWTRVAFHRLV